MAIRKIRIMGIKYSQKEQRGDRDERPHPGSHPGYAGYDV